MGLWLQWIWPIAGPITLTGSFGELRGTTFHTGIDISVGEKLGTVPVLAAADGYVYRLRVSHTGFGKVLYVRHPEGLVTVYGHLSHFSPRGEAEVVALQKAQRRFEVERFFTPQEWAVKAGDTLGWAGNSGYSLGPHLHFEVRTATEKPLCPLRYLPPLPDTQPPVFFRLAVQPLTPTSGVQGWNEKRLLRFRQVSATAQERRYRCLDTLTIQGTVGLEYTAADRFGGGTAWLGLARIQLYDGGTLLYQASWETLDFDWRRFVQWYIDYRYRQIYRIGIARLYEPPLTPWGQGKGHLQVPPGAIKPFRIVARDFAGNTAEVIVVLRGGIEEEGPMGRRPMAPRARWSIEEGLLLSREPLRTPWGDTVTPTRPLPLAGRLPDTLYPMKGAPLPTYLAACMPPGHAFTLPIALGCSLVVSQETLQETLYCQIKPLRTPWGLGFLIGDTLQPLRFPAELVWQTDSPTPTKTYPLYRPPGSAIWSPVLGAKREGRRWRIPVRSWGSYALMVDTFPPQIRPLSPKGPFYLVSIEDLGSGVSPYTLQVSSEKGPIPAEYYEPQRILYLPKAAGKRFYIEVADRVGNRSSRTLSYR